MFVGCLRIIRFKKKDITEWCDITKNWLYSITHSFGHWQLLLCGTGHQAEQWIQSRFVIPRHSLAKPNIKSNEATQSNIILWRLGHMVSGCNAISPLWHMLNVYWQIHTLSKKNATRVNQFVVFLFLFFFLLSTMFYKGHRALHF